MTTEDLITKTRKLTTHSQIGDLVEQHEKTQLKRCEIQYGENFKYSAMTGAYRELVKTLLFRLNQVIAQSN